MSGYTNDNLHVRGDARRLLRERLEREHVGEEAYNKMISQYDDRPFKIFGILFVLAFAIVAFGAVWMGY